MDGVLCVTPAELAESTGPVTFHPEPRSFALEELGTLPGFERVVALDLTRWGVDDAEAKVLAKKVDLSAIERLQFAWNGLTVAGVRALLKKGVLPALRHLDLSFNGIGNAGTKAIVTSPTFEQLESLRLELTDTTDAGGKAVAAAGSPTLRRLNLADASLKDASLAPLFASEAYPALEALILRNHRMSPKLAKTLPDIWRLPPPRVLDLMGGRIDAKVLTAWKGAPFLERVEHLVLDSNPVHAAGAAALAENEALRGLRTLSLRKCRIEDAGAEALAASEILAGLEALDLEDEHHPVGAAGAAALAESPHLASSIRAAWASRAGL